MTKVVGKIHDFGYHIDKNRYDKPSMKGYCKYIFLWGTFGCNSVEPPPKPVVEDNRPDIVLVTIDTLRADRLGAYGDQHAQTPNLDQFAREGILYAESHSVTPLTLPSHASIFDRFIA